MQESSGIITADILVSCKNDHTVPDQQLGCPRKLSGKQYLPLEECQKKDVPEQSYPWYVLETSNTKPLKILQGWNLKPGFSTQDNLIIAPHLGLKFWNVSKTKTQVQESVSYDS